MNIYLVIFLFMCFIFAVLVFDKKRELFVATPVKATPDELQNIVELPAYNMDGRYGFLEDDVKNRYPSLLYQDDKGRKKIDYASIVPLVVGNVAQLKNQIGTMTSDVSVVKNDSIQMKGQIDILKTGADSQTVKSICAGKFATSASKACMSDGQFCIGNTCVNESDLARLRNSEYK
jgi:hypothetical protein